ncbi:SPOR domain-containing protein [Fodinibius sp.]|uniref:SPOR domain-containing protein n=1 Tax=Fodinibius sp. TaxID=1872440 RepID=UPI002ACD8B0A|nr:SPOR domain-containing protein [Fodinibius sp.]MDZ7660128.1 SPOR domain-containing protein [Fodinibius sp.]
MKHFSRYISFSFVILLVFGIISCKTTEQTTPEQEDPTGTDRDEPLSEFLVVLDETRSSLSDVYLSQKQDIPDIYLKADSAGEQVNRNPYDGYRIQILSTRNVEQADSVANSFRMWSDSTIAGYEADAYVSFRQPHFKVHVGDFQIREQANKFSRLIKKRYPNAWVVHDRIEPSDVPADTATFSFVETDTTAAKQD